jgi:hypothetical protein
MALLLTTQPGSGPSQAGHFHTSEEVVSFFVLD